MKINLLALLFAVFYLTSSVYSSEDVDVYKFRHARDPKTRVLLNDIFLNSTTFSTRQLTAKINEYMDVIFEELSHYLTVNGYDPLDLPDIEKGFSFKFLLITYHGELKLKKGWLHELTSIKRNGDVILKYESLFLHVQVPISFKTLMFNYDYSAKLMNLGPTGGIEGKVRNIKIYTDVLFDLKELKLYLQDFNIEKIGDIDVKFTGHVLVDWIINILSDVTTGLLKGIIQNILEGKVYTAMQSITDQINQDLENVFG